MICTWLDVNGRRAKSTARTRSDATRTRRLGSRSRSGPASRPIRTSGTNSTTRSALTHDALDVRSYTSITSATSASQVPIADASVARKRSLKSPLLRSRPVSPVRRATRPASSLRSRPLAETARRRPSRLAPRPPRGHEPPHEALCLRGGPARALRRPRSLEEHCPSSFPRPYIALSQTAPTTKRHPATSSNRSRGGANRPNGTLFGHDPAIRRNGPTPCVLYLSEAPPARGRAPRGRGCSPRRCRR
jgi:hypothetical protein